MLEQMLLQLKQIENLNKAELAELKLNQAKEKATAATEILQRSYS